MRGGRPELLRPALQGAGLRALQRCPRSPAESPAGQPPRAAHVGAPGVGGGATRYRRDQARPRRRRRDHRGTCGSGSWSNPPEYPPAAASRPGTDHCHGWPLEGSDTKGSFDVITKMSGRSGGPARDRAQTTRPASTPWAGYATLPSAKYVPNPGGRMAPPAPRRAVGPTPRLSPGSCTTSTPSTPSPPRRRTCWPSGSASSSPPARRWEEPTRAGSPCSASTRPCGPPASVLPGRAIRGARPSRPRARPGADGAAINLARAEGADYMDLGTSEDDVARPGPLREPRLQQQRGQARRPDQLLLEEGSCGCVGGGDAAGGDVRGPARAVPVPERVAA